MKAKKTDDFFTTLECHIEDDLLRRFTNEIKSVNLTIHPTAATFLLRALIETTLNWCIDEKKLRPAFRDSLKKPVTPNPKSRPPKEGGLADIIRFCAKNHDKIFSEPRAQSLLNYWLSEKTAMDLVIHGRWMHADKAKLKTAAAHSRHLLQKILDRSALV